MDRIAVKRYKLALLMHKVLHGEALHYLGPLIRVYNLPGQRALRSASTNHLVTTPVKLSTVGNRAFVVAVPHIWNGLPNDVILADSLLPFRYC